VLLYLGYTYLVLEAMMASSSGAATAGLVQMSWNEFEQYMKRKNSAAPIVYIEPTSLFRITRIVCKNGYVLMFLTGYLADANGQLKTDEIFQFYTETKFELYSYKKCFDTHSGNYCYRKCQSYKTFVMPGLESVCFDRINVIKYKRNKPLSPMDNKNCLDAYMKDTNRFHMQNKLKEGQYVRFKTRQKCINGRLSCDINDSEIINDLFVIIDIKDLTVEIIPIHMAFDIETYCNGQRFSTPEFNHIFAISIVVKKNNRYMKICLFYMKNKNLTETFVRAKNKDFDDTHTVVIECDTEREMISYFFKLFSLLNADVILNWNGNKFDIPFILTRYKMLSSSSTNKKDGPLQIQRYNLECADIETEMLCDKFMNKLDNFMFVYYIHIDLYQSLSMDSEYGDVENFQLNTVARQFLNAEKVNLPISEMINLYDCGQMSKIIEYNVWDSVLPVDLAIKLEVLNFVYIQCAVLHLCTDDVLKNISYKINIILFYEALNNMKLNTTTGVRVPDPFFFNKWDLNVTVNRKRTWDKGNAAVVADNDTFSDIGSDMNTIDFTKLKRTPIDVALLPDNATKLCPAIGKCLYKGGKVLTPVPGCHDNSFTLDFNSLYLRIMVLHTICLTNLVMGSDGYVYLINNPKAPTVQLLNKLFALRSSYKKLRDNYEVGTFQYNLYDKLQNAIKRIANSIYGYYGIFFKPIANYITRIGRQMLSKAIKKIESMSDNREVCDKFGIDSMSLKVIYGDTDSTFVKIDVKSKHEIDNEKIKNILNYIVEMLNPSLEGHNMALENIIPRLILLKKKKYCYLNTENRIKYKGWLIKKDMPIFMRASFRQVVDSFLYGHSVKCGMELLFQLMKKHYEDFGKNNNVDNYCFSMSYNENSTSKNKKTQTDGPPRKKPITIAKHCREILANSGTDFLPGNGDRIPFVLIDIKGKITEKAYPLTLFSVSDPTIRISWMKHMGILCTFINELIEVFGDNDSDTFVYYFEKINNLYMSNQQYDIKYPALVPLTKSKLNAIVKNNKIDDDDDDIDNANKSDIDEGALNDHEYKSNDDDDNNNPQLQNELFEMKYKNQFSMYVKRPNLKFVYKPNTMCSKCNKLC
jgi:DNA polymerase elongation subunit (family B)